MSHRWATDRRRPAAVPLPARPTTALLAVVGLLVVVTATVPVTLVTVGRPGADHDRGVTATAPAPSPPGDPDPPPVRPPPTPHPRRCAPVVIRDVPDGSLGVPLLLPDEAGVPVLRPGDRVDLVAAGAGGGWVLAREATVLTLAPRCDTGPGPPRTTVYLAVDPAQAHRVASTAPDVPVRVTVHPRRAL